MRKKKRNARKRASHEFQKFSPQKGKRKEFLSAKEESVNKGR